MIEEDFLIFAYRSMNDHQRVLFLRLAEALRDKLEIARQLEEELSCSLRRGESSCLDRLQ